MKKLDIGCGKNKPADFMGGAILLPMKVSIMCLMSMPVKSGLLKTMRLTTLNWITLLNIFVTLFISLMSCTEFAEMVRLCI